MARASEELPYWFLIPPNPQSVYPDKLPFDIPAGTPRPVTQLIDHLDETGSRVRVLYPLERLVERRDRPMSTRAQARTGRISAPSWRTTP